MNAPIVPPASLGGLITVRSVAPQVADAAQNATAIKAQIGQLVSGTIFGMDGNGEPLMKSEQGDLALKLPFHLPSGTDVVLRMEAAPGGMRARILSLDGLTPKDYEARLTAKPSEAQLTQDSVSLTPNLARPGTLSAAAQQAQQIAALPLEGDPAAIARRAAALRAAFGNLPLPEEGEGQPLPNPPQIGTLLSRSADLPQLIRQLPANFPLPARLQTGANLLLQVVAMENPPAHGGTAPAPLPNDTSTPAGFSQLLERLNQRAQPALVTPLEASLPLAEVAPSQAAPLAQSTLQNTLAAMSGEALLSPPSAQMPAAAPAVPQPAMPSAQNPTLLPAQVIGIEPNGDALLHTPLGVVRLPQNPAMPMTEGAQVQIQWLGAQEGVAMPLPNNQPPLTPSGGWLPLADRWASLDDTLAVLNTGTAPGLQALPRLPQPNAHMGADLLFFLSALQEGNALSWIGRPAASQLGARGRQDLLQRLGEDFSALSQPLLHSPSQQWQALLFPVYVEGHLHQARLFVGRHPQEEKEKAEGRTPDTRFVLEVTLSSLGDMQLCGLVRKPAPQNIQFDLIVRSKRELDAQARTDIQGIFESGAQLTGYKGQILFQHSPDFPEHPLESFKASGAGMMA